MAVWTAAILLAVNAGFLVARPFSSVDPDSLPSAHTWVWWATKEFTDLPKAPDVVLLGSSMVMHPISRLDADLHQKNLDYVRHHRSNYIEQELRKSGLNSEVCYNFALPGGMMSDNYLIMRALMQGPRKPRVAVLAVSMRDFMDCCVRCVGATPAFKLLSRYTQLDDLVDISMPQLWQRFDYYAKKDVYLWGKKLDLQVLLSEQTKTVLGPVFASHFAPSKLAEADPTKNLPMNQRSEVEWFPVIANEPTYWNDNTPEYRKRYRHANDKLFDTEMVFLKKTAELARQNDIQLLIVNMPLTPENHALMPPSAYEHYRAALQSFSNQNGIAFVDLDGNPQFSKTDFYDTAHMNSRGGKKLANAILSALTSDQKLATALRKPPEARQIAVKAK